MHKHINRAAVGICAAYCVLSSVSVLHNKFLLSSIFPHENSLLLMQNFVTIGFLLLASSRFVQFCPLQSVRRCYIPVTLYHSPGDWVIGLCYSLNVLTGMWCLNYLSVPMFSSIKRCNIIVVWLIEVFFAPNNTTNAALLPLLTLIAGTALMSYYDLHFSALGYFFGIVSCVFQSASFELGKRLVNHGKDLWSVLMINSIVSTVVQLVYMMGEDEMPYLKSLFLYLTVAEASQPGVVPLFLKPLRKGNPVEVAAAMSPTQLATHLCCNSFLIMAMNYSIFLNCSVNSPLAHAVTGNVKAVVTVVSGILLFAVPLRPMAALGITIGLIGGAWFSKIKLDDQARKHAAQVKSMSEDALEEGRSPTCASPVVDAAVVLRPVSPSSSVGSRSRHGSEREGGTTQHV